MLPSASRHDELRALWPAEVTREDLVSADPSVAGSARRGWSLLALSIASTVLWAVPLRIWGEVQLHGLLQNLLGAGFSLATIALILVALVSAVGAFLEFCAPRRCMRSIEFTRFASAAGLRYRAREIWPERRGIFFGEPGDHSTARSGGHFNGEHLLTADTRGATAGIRMGLAKRRSGAGPAGPYRSFRYLIAELPVTVPHLVLDGRANGALSHVVPQSQRVMLEGDVDRYFATYAPEGYARDALEVLTPDVLAALIDTGADWDFEWVDNLLIVVSRKASHACDRDETIAMLVFAETIVPLIARQAERYSNFRIHAASSGSFGARRRTRLSWRTLDWGVVLSLGAFAAAVLAAFVLQS